MSGLTVCAECGDDIEPADRFRRVCCSCGATLHDDCYLGARLERSYDGLCHWTKCDCGGCFNLWSFRTRLTSCDEECEGCG